MVAGTVAELSGALRERERELALIEAAVDTARGGAGAVAVVEGPPGVGKSSLLAAGRELAGSAGMSTLQAQSSELEQGFSFGVVVQLLGPLVEAGRDVAGDTLFRGAAALTVRCSAAAPPRPRPARAIAGTPCSTGCTGSSPTSRRASRCCSPSTMPTGRMRPRSTSCTTCSADSTTSRSRSSSRSAQASPNAPSWWRCAAIRASTWSTRRRSASTP